MGKPGWGFGVTVGLGLVRGEPCFGCSVLLFHTLGVWDVWDAAGVDWTGLTIQFGVLKLAKPTLAGDDDLGRGLQTEQPGDGETDVAVCWLLLCWVVVVVVALQVSTFPIVQRLSVPQELAGARYATGVLVGGGRDAVKQPHTAPRHRKRNDATTVGRAVSINLKLGFGGRLGSWSAVAYARLFVRALLAW